MIKLWHQFYNFDTGEFSKEFEDFQEQVIVAGGMNFDCEQVAAAILQGDSAQEAAKQFNKDFAEMNYDQNGDRIIIEDFEDYLNHDMSMNR